MAEKVPVITSQDAAKEIDRLYRNFATLTVTHDLLSAYLADEKRKLLEQFDKDHADELARAKQLADDVAEAEQHLRDTARDYAVETHEQRLHPEVLVKRTTSMPLYGEQEIVDFYLQHYKLFPSLMTVNRRYVAKLAASADRPSNFPVIANDDWTVNVGKKNVANYAEGDNGAHTRTE